MSTLKVFTLGNNGYITREIGELIGEASHVRQARILVAASSKIAAIDLATACGLQVPRNQRQICQAAGDHVEALQAAGWLYEPTVLVLPLTSATGKGVARLAPGATPVRIGGFTWSDADRRSVFEPA